MKVSQQLINRYISEIAGSEALPIVKELRGNKVISEFKLAEKVDLEVNQTRSLLYKLYQVNLVEFTRKKDKKKGWYVYYWSFSSKHLDRFISKARKKRIELLRDRLKEEREGNFFSCEERCTRLDFSKAVDLEFKCPECGRLLDLVNREGKIEELEEELRTVQKELKIITKI